MTDKPARVLPSSRQPVTPEYPASELVATTGPAYVDPPDEPGMPAVNPLFPTVSHASAVDPDEPTRTATLEDAHRFAGGTTTMHLADDDTTEIPAATDSAALVGTGGAAGAASGSTALAGAAGAAPPAERGSGSDSGKGDRSPVPAPPPPAARPTGPRSAEQIERDLDQTRRHLAYTVDEISERIKPANVADQAKSQARGLVLTPQGELRTERLGPVGGGLLVLLALRWLRRRRKRRRARAL